MPKNDSEVGAEAEGAEAGPSLGGTLRAAREQQGLSLEQVAAELRLEPRFLRALEDERFDDISAPVFARGYLRQYGKRLGLDYEKLLSDYHSLGGVKDVEFTVTRDITTKVGWQTRIWMLLALALVLLTAVAVVWWFGGIAGFAGRFGLSSSNPATLPYPSPLAEDTTAADPFVPPALPVEASVAAADPQVALPVEASVAAADPHIALRVEASVAAADPQVEFAEDALDSPSVSEDVIGEFADPAGAVDDLAGYATVEVELTFTEDCWAEVTDARGVRLVYDLGRAGEQRRFVGAAPVAFLLGNARGARLSIDGGPHEIPRSDTLGAVVGFTVDASAD